MSTIPIPIHSHKKKHSSTRFNGVIDDLAFIYLATVAACAGILTVFVKSPVRSAISLVVVVFHVAGLFALLDTLFLAVIQLIVYAGAIIVLFLFTIMLLDLRHEQGEPHLHKNQLWLGLPLALLILIEAGWIALTTPVGSMALRGEFGPQAVAEMGGGGQALASVLFTDYLLPFEVAGLLLLTASVGALILARSPDENLMPESTDPIADAAGPQAGMEDPTISHG